MIVSEIVVDGPQFEVGLYSLRIPLREVVQEVDSLSLLGLIAIKVDLRAGYLSDILVNITNKTCQVWRTLKQLQIQIATELLLTEHQGQLEEGVFSRHDQINLSYATQSFVARLDDTSDVLLLIGFWLVLAESSLTRRVKIVVVNEPLP